MKEENQDIKLLVRLKNTPEKKAPENKTENEVEKKDKNAKDNAKDKKTPTLQNKDKKDAKKPPQKNAPVAIEPSEKDDTKYTIFTSVQPSKTIICTNTPISKKLINSTFIREDDLYEYSYTFIKDSTLLEFDRIYSDSTKLENIYNEQIKDCISNLFLGKNACILQFGPSNSGKTYSLQNPDVSDPGLIPRSLNDIFNLIEISKSTAGRQPKNSTTFSVKISIYQVYNDCLNDLLSPQYTKNLTVERNFDEEENSNSNKNLIPELSSRELKSKKDFEILLKEAENTRKNLAQILKVNDINKKSHIVTTLQIEKREKIPDGYNRLTEQCMENFAQIDFVELADSNFGLSSQPENGENIDDSNIEPVDDLLYRFISKTFNSVTNNILAASNGKSVKNDTKLTLALKNTLKINSQIIMVTNADPSEEPLLNSIKALKFSNWLRNQLLNQREYVANVNKEKKFNRRDYEHDRERGREREFNNTNILKDSSEIYDEENSLMKNERKRLNRKSPNERVKSREYNYGRDKPERDENTERENIYNYNYNYNNNNQNKEKERDRRGYNNNDDYDYSDGIKKRSNEVIGNMQYNNTYGDEGRFKYENNTNNKPNNYLASIDRLEDFEDNNNRFNYKYQTINDDGNIEDDRKENFSTKNYNKKTIDRSYMENRRNNNQIEIPQNQNQKSYENIINNQNNSSLSNNNNNLNQSKLVDVEKTLKDLEMKSLEMSRHIEVLRNDRSKIDENKQQIYPQSQSYNNFNNINPNLDYEFEKIRQENSMLKSDNIIFREDINRLSDLNRHLEEEIRKQRERNLELASENERINQEKILLKSNLDSTNDALVKNKVQEQSQADQLSIKFVLENKIRDLENENRLIRDEKQRYEIDFKVLQERHFELKKNFDQIDNELNFVKHKQSEEVDNIENKLDKMTKEIENLQRDNNILRQNEERIRQESLGFERQRESYREKYQDIKSKNNILNTKLTEIEEEFRRLVQEKQNEVHDKKKEEEYKKQKIDSKHKILEDMQSKIMTYKTEILKNRNKKD